MPISVSAVRRRDRHTVEEGNGIGSPGARPSVARPGSSNTGPRQSTTSSMSASDALTAVLAAPAEADGRRYLRRVAVSGQLTLDSSTHTGIVFEDCTFSTGGNYGMRAFTDGTSPSDVWPEFRWCRHTGGSSAVVYGRMVRLLRCDLSEGTDILKPTGPAEVWASWLHDTYHGVDAHCDVVQIVSGCSGLLLHYNTMDGFNAASSPEAAGEPCSGVLQTGTVTGDIGPVTWRGNWFDGGGYTIRSANDDTYDVDYTFRDNRFGTGYRYGALYEMGDADFDTSNVWDATGLPVDP